MPARWVPLLYLGLAHISLVSALAALAVSPRSLMGFYYHPRMLAVVHLVTLGWISASILGALYLVAPLAFRTPLPARRADYWAFGAYAVGVLGMVSHFWIDSPRGMAWAAPLPAATIVYVSARVLAGLRRAPVPGEARLPMALALLNGIAAAALGGVVALDKVSPYLGVAHLGAVYAHAHLAAIGWGALMVVGAGYRILPMILPAAMPRGFWAYASSVLVEAGLGGLVCSLFLGARLLLPWAALLVCGVAAFLSRVVWMARHRRPGPSERLLPDWGAAHVLQALAYLAVACALGLYLAGAERSPATIAAAWIYGVTGLIGFLSQIIVGVEARVLPLFAWLWGFADRSHSELPPSVHRVSVRSLQLFAFVSWTAAVPLLAGGLALDVVPLASASAAALLLAVAANLANGVVVLRRLWRRDPRALR
jgi:hypothetical protein